MNARRKSDRESIARMFISIAEAYGASVERRDEGRNPGYHGPSIHLNFELNGCGVMVNIDDLHGGDHALLHWYSTDGGWRDGEYEPPKPYRQEFNAAVGDHQQWRPHTKATSDGTWDMLAKYLDAGLSMAEKGTAKEERKDGGR